MNYRSLYESSGIVENNFDPNSRVGLIIADQARDESEFSDPLDVLIAAEEYLMQEHGMTLLQAARKGITPKPKPIN